MSILLERLAAGETLVSDGATGTYLQEHGLEPGGCPERFNLEQPEIVRGMARAYFDAGSDMVLTNSFGGSRFMLKKYGLGDRVAEVNRLAAELARSAAPPGHFVLGSIGPTGEFLQPSGPLTESQMLEAFAEQALGLAAGGVDAFCVETMSDLAEATLAIRAARQSTGLPVCATLTFDKGPRGFFTMMGVTPAGAAAGLSEAGADMVGANCGLPIGAMIQIIAAMRPATDRPILTHVNAGLPRIIAGRVVYPETPEQMGPQYPRLVEAGAQVVGGCCGTGPEHVRAIVRALRG
jgi:5-methyltetrahydrofolate--homocysteine methyltransferase